MSISKNIIVPGNCRRYGDELRRKIHDVQAKFPPGVLPSVVRDDFGEVYGIFLALTGDGFSYAELKDYADMLQRELLLVEDVSRVELWGLQKECIVAEVSPAQMAESRTNPQVIISIMQQQNQIVHADGSIVEVAGFVFSVSGTFHSIEEIGDLVVNSGGNTQILLRDIATIRHDYIDPPEQIMRFNGRPAIGLAISNVSGSNVIKMGDAVKNRLQELQRQLPIGLKLNVVSFQSETVRHAVDSFILNLIESVSIVILVSCFWPWGYAVDC